MKIVFPEIATNEKARRAVARFPEVEWLTAESLDAAVAMVKKAEVDTMISGIDYSSREVLLKCRDGGIELKSRYFSSCFVCKGDGETLILADGGVNKQPNEEQLYTIVEDTAKTHMSFFETTPRIAMLSYSTYGSGGKNPDLEKIYAVIERVRTTHPDWVIDGEMQLDAATNPVIAAKKTPKSPLSGQANILIVPDLNSGNILYKALERYGGFVVAGPIIQGFSVPLADLSRGSTENDVVFTIDVIKKLYERSKK